MQTSDFNALLRQWEDSHLDRYLDSLDDDDERESQEECRECTCKRCFECGYGFYSGE